MPVQPYGAEGGVYSDMSRPKELLGNDERAVCQKKHKSMYDCVDQEHADQVESPTVYVAPECPPQEVEANPMSPSPLLFAPDRAAPIGEPTSQLPTSLNQPSSAQGPVAGRPGHKPEIALRRSTRQRKQRECYDPSSGTSCRPTAVGDDE